MSKDALVKAAVPFVRWLYIMVVTASTPQHDSGKILRIGLLVSRTLTGSLPGW